MSLLLISLIIISTGCSKEEYNEVKVENTASIKENVTVINPEEATLISNNTDLSKGIYKFEFNETPKSFSIGDIIVGKKGYGFLRKVNNVSYNNNTVIFETEQAALTDVFNQANYSFGPDDFQGISKINYVDKDISMLKSANSPSSFEYDFSNTILYENDDLVIKVETGKISNSSSYNYSASIDWFEVNTEMITTSVFDIQCVISIVGSKKISIADINRVLADVEHIVVFDIYGVPIVFVIDTKCSLHYTADFLGEINTTVNLSQKYTSRYGIIYQDGEWIEVNETVPTFPSNPIDLTGTNASLSQKLTIVPSVSFKLYDIAGFTFTPTLWGQFDFNIGYPANWDALLKAGVNLNIGVEASILGLEAAENWDIYTNEWDIWSAPYLLTKVSGDAQQGPINGLLAQPLEVMATDNWNNPLPGVLVHYNLTNDDGSVSDEITITNTSGLATTNWTLGTLSGTQTVTAQIKKADGSNINGSPQTFSATAF